MDSAPKDRYLEVSERQKVLLSKRNGAADAVSLAQFDRAAELWEEAGAIALELASHFHLHADWCNNQRDAAKKVAQDVEAGRFERRLPAVALWRQSRYSHHGNSSVCAVPQPGGITLYASVHCTGARWSWECRVDGKDLHWQARQELQGKGHGLGTRLGAIKALARHAHQKGLLDSDEVSE